MAQTADGGRRPLSRDTLGESEGVVALFRTLLVAVVLVGLMLPESGALPAGSYLLISLAGLYCLIGTLFVWRRVRFAFRRHLLLLADILWLTLLIHASGGIRGGLFPLYYLTVIVGAMWFGIAGAVAAAAIATLAFVSATWLTAPPERVFYLLRHLVSPQILMLFLAAILCAYLAEAWHAEREEKERQEQVNLQFRKQMAMAQELQTLILPPSLPVVPGIELGVRTRQAALVVGGDYYDGLAFDDGTLGLCCADVSGKSVPGQLRLPLVKYALRVCASLFREPRQVVERLNRLLYDELPPEMFVSLVYVVLDPAREVAVMAGKHCPPLRLVASTGQVKAVELKGVVLGMEPDIRYEAVEVPLAADDYLVLYTDGVIEAKDRRGRELEVAGLTRLLAEATPESAQDLANWLFQALEEHEVGEKRDDLTVVVARRAGRAG